MSARLDERRRKFLAEKNRAFLEAEPDLGKLRRRLLRVGGEEVVLCKEPHLEKILARGRAWQRIQPELRPGEINECHKHVARLFREDPRALQIVTGWALHPDDVVWRQHSWLLRDRVLVETTDPARAYYGVVLDSEEAVRFARSELGTRSR